MFGDVGLGLSKPVKIGGVLFKAHAEVLALIRDDRLRALGAPRGETGTVVPLVTVGLTLAY